jgi:uncharacterized protein YciI
MAEFEIEVTEVNQGFVIVEADSLDEAIELANADYYGGQVVWHGVDVSFKEGN